MEANNTTQVRTAGALTFLAGLWLLLSPLTITLTTSALWSQLIVGAILFIAGAVEVARPKTDGTSWISGLAGLWMVVSPIVLTVSTTATWNQVILGALAIGFAIWDGVEVGQLNEAKV